MKATTLILLSLALCAGTTLWLAGPACAQNPMTLVGHYWGSGYDYFGLAIATGDFNSNGYDEFILGAYGWNNLTGKNYIYAGGPQFPTEAYLTIQGQHEQQCYDVSDANVGDINGDGVDDFAIPALIYGVGIDTAKIDVYLGGNPLDTIPDWTFRLPVGPYDYMFDIDSCGDVNGDGGNDFIVRSTPVPLENTVVYIFFGGAVLDTIPDWTYTEPSTNRFINGLGDVNGDEYADILFTEAQGIAMIFYGANPLDTIPDLIFNDGYGVAQAAAGIRDFNGDGYNDVAMNWRFPDSTHASDLVYFGGPQMDTEPDLELKLWDGQYSFSLHLSCGDFNGDGWGDIISSAPWAGGTAVQIFLGGPQYNPIPDAFVIGSAWDGYGSNINSADVNGDGNDELLVTQMEEPFYPGEVFLYQGPSVWVDYGVGAVSPAELQHQPGWFVLDQNYPNPFNTSTAIHFSLGKPSVVTMTVYDLEGNLIKQLMVDKNMPPGGYTISWSGKNEHNEPVASGIYILKMKVSSFVQVRKIVLLR